MLGSALGKTFTSVPDYYSSYGVVLAVVAAGAILVIVAFTAARLIAPHRPSRAKLTTYECGIDPVGEGWSQSQIRYYVFALLFVIFDVEAVFIYPWAIQFRSLGAAGLLTMFSFVATLALALVYCWKKGALEWEK